MNITLRPYQNEAVQAVYQYLANHDDNPCVVTPTASGKSVMIAKIASDAVKLWRGRVLILAHVKELLEQNAGKVKALCDDIEVGIYSAGLNSRDTDTPILVAGIQSVYNKAELLGKFDLIVVDEAHCIAPDGEGMYRTFLTAMQKKNPLIRVIGFTATPYRMKGGLICKPENILNKVCYEVGIKEMIAQGYLSPLVSYAGKAEADLSNLHIRGGEFIADEIDKAMDDERLVQFACHEIYDKTLDRKSVLIFTSSVKHCKHVAKTLEAFAKQEVAIVTGDTPDDERAEILARFKGEQVKDLLGESKPPLKFLCNVNVLTTGFDAPNVDCVVLLRPTNSPGLYVQMCLDAQTEILTHDGWKNKDTIKDTDWVAAFNMQTEKIEFCHIENRVERILNPGESMMEISSPHLDVRVTNLHDFVYMNRNKIANWRKRTADDMRKMKDSFFIPVAANYDGGNGLPLSDDEIRFIGWTLTDGSISKHDFSVTITQSVNSPCNDAIVSMLEGCGFAYRRYRRKYKGDLAKYADNYRYYVTFQNPRGENKGKQGWCKLFAYLTTRFSDAMHGISQHQIEILLEAMNLANGKKCKTLSWIPRGYTISFGDNKFFADDFQSVMIQNGYRCNLAAFKQKTSFHSSEPKTQYIAYVKKQYRATVGGCHNFSNFLVKNRCSIQPSAFSENEVVWCVKNRLGTLVTRRNGKVAILGNCGRGFRLSPETGKTNCLVLDYGENIMRHGPIDCVRARDTGPGNGKAPAKMCPECRALIHASYSVCPECGFQFPVNNHNIKISPFASKDGILSGQVSYEEYDVEDVSYEIHKKRNNSDAPPTLQVNYRVGMYQFKHEWVCPEHTGYARQKFETWWYARAAAGIMPPDTVEEALSLARDGVLATPLKIRVKSVSGEKFERIVRCTLGARPVIEHAEIPDEEIPF